MKTLAVIIGSTVAGVVLAGCGATSPTPTASLSSPSGSASASPVATPSAGIPSTSATSLTLTADGGHGQLTVPAGLAPYTQCNKGTSVFSASAFVEDADRTVYRLNLSVAGFHGAGTYRADQGASVVLTVVGKEGDPQTTAKLQEGSGAPPGSGAGAGTVVIQPDAGGGSLNWSISNDATLGNYSLAGTWSC